MSLTARCEEKKQVHFAKEHPDSSDSSEDSEDAVRHASDGDEEAYQLDEDVEFSQGSEEEYDWNDVSSDASFEEDARDATSPPKKRTMAKKDQTPRTKSKPRLKHSNAKPVDSENASARFAHLVKTARRGVAFQ